MGKRNTNNSNKKSSVASIAKESEKEMGNIKIDTNRHATTYSDDEGNVIVGPDADTNAQDPIPELDLDANNDEVGSIVSVSEVVSSVSVSEVVSSVSEVVSSVSEVVSSVSVNEVASEENGLDIIAKVEVDPPNTTPPPVSIVVGVVGDMDVVLISIPESPRRIGICASIRNAFRAICQACCCCFCCCRTGRNNRGATSAATSAATSTATSAATSTAQ